jgi:hypothetical protein
MENEVVKTPFKAELVKNSLANEKSEQILTDFLILNLPDSKLSINLSSENQADLKNTYAALIAFCIKNPTPFEFVLEPISNQEDLGIFNVSKDFIEMLNDDIGTILVDISSNQKENKMK